MGAVPCTHASRRSPIEENTLPLDTQQLRIRRWPHPLKTGRVSRLVPVLELHSKLYPDTIWIYHGYGGNYSRWHPPTRRSGCKILKPLIYTDGYSNTWTISYNVDFHTSEYFQMSLRNHKHLLYPQLKRVYGSTNVMIEYDAVALAPFIPRFQILPRELDTPLILHCQRVYFKFVMTNSF